ncbi:uncharacterized protein VTP21DRAFT_4235 [Calcarisporiella thermophila]|uniref:uncharacterized protein n=1 Tax=Calcarisporiella thermophila TaxID=911321 RepID=UPI003742F28E
MSLDSGLSLLHLNLPTLQLGGRSSSSVRTTVNPVVFFTILDHYLRRNDNQERVIGTLLGVRSEDGSEVEIRNCFPIPHKESPDQVEVDMEYHHTMYELHHKVNPKEVIVGWYATGADLNSYSALIQDFYNRQCAPFPAVHLTLDTELKKERVGVKAYVSAPVGVGSKPENCLFLPVPTDVKYFEAERAGLNILAMAKNTPDRTASLLSDMDSLEQAVLQLQEMLERVSEYVSRVISNEVQGNDTVGRFLMDAVASVPRVDAEAFEKMFNSHLQDVLMVIYLANMTRTQLAIAQRLQPLV